MLCTMATGKDICLALVLLALTSVFSVSDASPSKGRKLFGGYRIVPKVCKPSIPSRVRSDEPAICMFNYECTRRNGEVVGACMDGFLFGACCQLPSKNAMTSNSPSYEPLPNLHEIDHVPDIPILLNPDGTPMGVTLTQGVENGKKNSTKNDQSSTGETTYTKLSMFTPNSNSDATENAEKPQLPPLPNVGQIEQDFPVLLGQQAVLDDLRLPGLLTHSDSNNDIQDHPDNSAMNPVTTLLSPDQILQIADPVDQLPALFSQGLNKNNYSTADTILLNENGTLLDESYNPDEFFKPVDDDKSVTESSMNTKDLMEMTPSSVKYRTGSSTTQWVKFPDQPALSTVEMRLSSRKQETTTPAMTKIETVTQSNIIPQKYSASKITVDPFQRTTMDRRTSNIILGSSTEEFGTTPMTTLADEKEELVRVPTITYDVQSGNKKDDTLDKEEIAINHIISILNDTTPGIESTVTAQGVSSPIHTWLNVEETSKPTLVKISTSKFPQTTTANTYTHTFYKPALPSTYYNYETVSTVHPSYSTSNFYSSSSNPSTKVTYGSSTNYGYTSRPTTHPPAPTVIVLGPLGTEYATETTQRTATRRPSTSNPVRPPNDSSRLTVKPTVKPITRPVVRITTVPPTLPPIKISTVGTKKPSVSTTITHNVSTVISNVATNNVVSTSYITVNLKDGVSTKPSTIVTTNAAAVETGTQEKIGSSTKRPTVWTTVSSWSNKPSFHLKPQSDFNWPSENIASVEHLFFKDPSTTAKPTPVPCVEDTAAPDDLINFPPVRNPNLNTSQPISQQEKPTLVDTLNNTGYPDIELISENDIPTPTFIEDDVLTNKVDAFVNKIVESLQGNFQDLKDVVYNRNYTSTSTSPTVTRRPTASGSTTRRPTRRPATSSRPSQVTTKRPTTTKRPPSGRPTSQKPGSRPTSKPTLRPQGSTPGVTTRKPQTTTKRPRPTRRPTTTIAPTELVALEETVSSTEATEATIAASDSASVPAFRSQCGVRPLVKRGRIVGGKGAKFGEWPWQVLVREATWLGLFTKNKCGGVLITDRYVITAAHCQPGFLASLVAVFGEFDISGELESKRSVSRNVRRVIVNRGYDPATFENDLALLELESPVQFDAHIVPICMPEDGADFTGRMATVTGWGRLKYNGGVPSVLQEVQVPIMENSVCQEMFQTAGHSKLILDSFLCAGYANGQKDSCEGDSGGPLVMERPDGRWFLVGTVSHGIKCAAPYLPGVYMRTTYFKPWLHSITGV